MIGSPFWNRMPVTGSQSHGLPHRPFPSFLEAVGEYLGPISSFFLSFLCGARATANKEKKEKPWKEKFFRIGHYKKETDSRSCGRRLPSHDSTKRSLGVNLLSREGNSQTGQRTNC